MKIKSLLLAGLAGVALASCGGVKSYETPVKRATFIKDLKSAFEKSAILGSDKTFSFEMESYSESKINEVYLKNDKELCEVISKSNAETFTQFDSVSNINYGTVKQHYYDKNANEEKTYDVEYESQMQIDAKHVYFIDMDAKLYTVENNSNPEEAVAVDALKTIAYSVTIFSEFIAAEDDDDFFPNAKFFEDGNVYTIENTDVEEEKDLTDITKDVYQIVLKEDGFEVHHTENREKKMLNYRKVVESSDNISAKRKDKVSLKEIDLHNYLEVDEIPTVL